LGACACDQEAVCAIDRDLIWQIYRRPDQGCGIGRRQHHPTLKWINKVKHGNNEVLKMIVDDSEAPEGDRWDFEVRIFDCVPHFRFSQLCSQASCDVLGWHQNVGDHQGLSKDEKADTQAAEPTW
jgi:hypothetical protein